MQSRVKHLDFERVDNVARPVRSRAAFTIIEVLVAVGLTSLLMAALYSAMSVYWTTAMESYDEIERTQIARALLREMARDIQSCTFSKQETTELDSSDDSSSITDTDPVDPETAMGAYTNGLLGSATDLVLYISRPDRNQAYVSAQELLDPSERSSDSMIIRYFLADSAAGGVSGMVADEALAGSHSNVDGAVGLAKMTGDLIGLSNAINQGNVDMQLQASDILAREVALIRFTYFDGVEEVEEWNSTLQGAMPLAVVIELTLRTVLPETEERKPEEIPGFMDESIHRLVVPIPVAEPYVGL
jgi:type II secretory pathway pseudopilin PulG